MNMIAKPTHDYVARDEHGCLVGLCSDIPEDKNRIAREIAKWISDGLSVTRCTTEEVRHMLDTEPFGCQQYQLELFGANQ